MNLRQRLALLTIFTLILLIGCCKAGSLQVSPTGGHSDQNIINDAIDTMEKSGGGLVYLNAGTYYVDGPVMVKSKITLAGDSNAIIKVYSGSSQWFQGSIGIISNAENLHDVVISGFQIDGSVPELPFEYHHSQSDRAHDCERCILFAGDSGNLMSSITICNMTLYDSFSDGIYIRFADNVHIYNNFISNTQHEGIFFQCCRYSLIKSNRIAGITSDCLRFDNCQNCEVRLNYCWSYDGTHASNAYLHGENGIQIGNTGTTENKGYLPTQKPFTTQNIYVHDNQFINNGLNAVLIDGDVKDDNVYFVNNKIIGHEQLENSGFPIEIIGNYSYEHPPSLQTSKKVFSSIFYILNINFQNSGYTNQQDESILYSVQKTTL
jgi:Pectate lyase superfamily protein